MEDKKRREGREQRQRERESERKQLESAECRVNERVKDSRIKGILRVERSC